MVKTLDFKRNLSLTQLIKEIETRTDFYLQKIKKIGQSDDIKALKTLEKEITFSMAAIGFALERKEGEFEELESNFNRIKLSCKKISELSAKCGISHECIDQINGQLFFIKKELNTIKALI